LAPFLSTSEVQQLSQKYYYERVDFFSFALYSKENKEILKEIFTTL